MIQITSLKGLAIIFIVLFHLCPQYFHFGYFGVEVFLVISGFLLMKSFQKQNMEINIPEFAKKKILRLFVPVAAIVIVTLCFAFFIQDCDDSMRSSVTAAHTLAGNANNFLDRLNADYFAADSNSNPFLHMWYLAVTVHIYILFALGCVLNRYLPKRIMSISLWVIGVGTFLWSYSYPIHQLLQSIGLSVWDQVRPVSYYLTLPRLWEPLAGIYLATQLVNKNKDDSPSPIKGNLLFLLGLFCIIIPALGQGVDLTVCSGLVVLGTCMVIKYADQTSWSKYLNNRVFLWIGTISFSLYLVHMPLNAFYRSWFLQTPDFFWNYYNHCYIANYCLSFQVICGN